MAARETIAKWQGRQDTPDKGILLERLRSVFGNPTLSLQSDFIDGKILKIKL